MENLSEIINQELKRKESILFKIKGKGYLSIDIYKAKNDRYMLNAHLQGDTSEKDAIIYMGDFLRSLPVEKVSGSFFDISLVDSQSMALRHEPIPRTPFCFYLADFRNLENQEEPLSLMEVLAGISKNIYGINFNSKTPYKDVFPGPFKKRNSLEKGIMVFLSHGLDHGTNQEKDAYEVILRLRNAGRLTGEDIKMLKEYSPPLIDDMPAIEHYEGFVLQKKPKITDLNFLKFLDNAPQELDLVSFTIFCSSFFISMGNKKSSNNPLTEENCDKSCFGSSLEWATEGTPNIQFCAGIIDSSKKDYFLDHIWNKYHLMTGDSIELVREAIEKDFE